MVRLVFLGLLAGCAFEVRHGSPPKTDRLDTLKPGISRTEDILQALGEPTGYGVSRLRADQTPRTIWFYDYTYANALGRNDVKILLVFFRQERYEGHLWFSETMRMKLE